MTSILVTVFCSVKASCDDHSIHNAAVRVQYVLVLIQGKDDGARVGSAFGLMRADIAVRHGLHLTANRMP
jgi:hypothetical protein